MKFAARIVVVVSLAMTGAGGIGATAAHAVGGPSVSPNTALRDGETVRVRGNARTIFLEENAEGSVVLNDGSGIAEPDGSTGIVVRRFIHQFDCAAPDAPCRLVAVDAIPPQRPVELESVLQFAPVAPELFSGLVAAGKMDALLDGLRVPIELSFASTQTVTVQWKTVVIPGAPGHQADPATDYTPAGGTVTFIPSETGQSATVHLTAATLTEPDEYVAVLFGNPTNATMGRIINLGFGESLNPAPS